MSVTPVSASRIPSRSARPSDSFPSIEKPVTKNRNALGARAAMKCLTARQPLPLLPTGLTWRWPTPSWRRSWDACGRWAPSRRRSSGKPRKSRLAQVSGGHVSLETRGRAGGSTSGHFAIHQHAKKIQKKKYKKKMECQTLHLFKPDVNNCKF